MTLYMYSYFHVCIIHPCRTVDKKLFSESLPCDWQSYIRTQTRMVECFKQLAAQRQQSRLNHGVRTHAWQ